MVKVQQTVWGFFAAVCMVFLFFCGQVKAEEATTIHVSNSTPAVGESVSVDVVATESDSIRVVYNPQVLKLTGCSKDYTTEENAVLFEGAEATLQFTAEATGKSSIIVSGSYVAGSSTSIQIGENTGERQNPQTDSADDTEDGQFVIDQVAYVVSERFSEEEIPAGFEKTRVEIDGYHYKALTNGSITLIYLKPAADISQDGVFYVYHTDENTVSSFEILMGSDGYVLLKKAENILENAREISFETGGRTLTGYQMGEDDGFILVYGTNQNNVTGWFQYDQQEQTIQRVNESLLAIAEQEDTKVETKGEDAYYTKWKQQRYILAVLVFVLVLFVVVIVNLILNRRHLCSEMREDEERDEENNTLLTQETEIDVQSKKEETDEPKEILQELKPEVFSGTKDIRQKKNSEEQVDILDLNDL